jgi:rRNA maturation endonuclease Nob1
MSGYPTLKVLPGDEFRIMCPACSTMWTTLEVPSECPECGREVTLRLVVRRAPKTKTKTR